MEELRICHRDLKFENILYYKKDEKEYLKLADFSEGKLIGYGPSECSKGGNELH